MYTHLIFQKKIEWVLHKNNSIKFIVTFECKMEHLKCANFSTLFLWRSVIPNVPTPKLTQVQTG